MALLPYAAFQRCNRRNPVPPGAVPVVWHPWLAAKEHSVPEKLTVWRAVVGELSAGATALLNAFYDRGEALKSVYLTPRVLEKLRRPQELSLEERRKLHGAGPGARAAAREARALPRGAPPPLPPRPSSGTPRSPPPLPPRPSETPPSRHASAPAATPETPPSRRSSAPSSRSPARRASARKSASTEELERAAAGRKRPTRTRKTSDGEPDERQAEPCQQPPTPANIENGGLESPPAATTNQVDADCTAW